jgi:16S rRNA processing protein RimM
MQDQDETHVIVGRFGRPFGVKGWIKVQSYTEPFDHLLAYSPLYVYQNHNWQPLPLADSRRQDDSLLFKLKPYDTPEQVSCLTNLAIAIRREQLAPLPSDQYYWHDLEGLTVVNLQGVELGKVDYLFNTGSNDIMVVKGEKQHLLPYRKPFIQAVDLALRRIVVDWDANF